VKPAPPIDTKPILGLLPSASCRHAAPRTQRLPSWLAYAVNCTWLPTIRMTRRSQVTSPGKPISADGIELCNPETIPIRRYRYRGNQIPNPRAQAA
jgi:hypothetical protein